MQKMLDAGVATRRGVMCAHREPVYRDEPWSCGLTVENCDCQEGTCVRLQQSEQTQDHSIVLPLFPQMTEAEQDTVVMALFQAGGI
jgi:dTDP-4-amino-4,6-dideoxygalactose transaminase